MNDRALRSVSLTTREEHFTITAASEMMSAFCLANSFSDLRERIDSIVVGINSLGEDVLVKDLGCTGSCLALLKDAFVPNAVQTIKNNLAIVHGGPFANIAHGCNSVVATNTALSLCDYTVTEAGFGSDCGALKFLDIKCGQNNIYPDLVIVNSTIRSLKYNGEGILEKGIENLAFHVKNMKKFNDNVLVVINRFEDDTEKEISYVLEYCKNVLDTKAVLSNMYFDGVNNTKDIVDTVIKFCSKENTKRFDAYDLNDDIFTKIDKFCKLYNAKEVVYKNGSHEKLEILGKKYPNYRICISKTPLSITDDKNVLGCPKDFTMTVTDAYVNGAGRFITVMMGNVITLPGLTRDAAYKNIDVIDNEVRGLF